MLVGCEWKRYVREVEVWVTIVVDTVMLLLCVWVFYLKDEVSMCWGRIDVEIGFWSCILLPSAEVYKHRKGRLGGELVRDGSELLAKYSVIFYLRMN